MDLILLRNFKLKRIFFNSWTLHNNILRVWGSDLTMRSLRAVAMSQYKSDVSRCAKLPSIRKSPLKQPTKLEEHARDTTEQKQIKDG